MLRERPSAIEEALTGLLLLTTMMDRRLAAELYGKPSGVPFMMSETSHNRWELPQSAAAGPAAAVELIVLPLVSDERLWCWWEGDTRTIYTGEGIISRYVINHQWFI